MKADEVREKYIEFFKSKPRNHKEISPSPLVLEGDSTTLFTSAGMQQLVPYLSGKKHPKGKRLVNSQPSLRTQDIEKVGDNRHTTFFEMLGNWSLGDYFKGEQLAWFWEFLTKELGLPKEKLWVSIFKGDKQVPRDEESFEIWKKLGIPEKRIIEYGVEENWWSTTGTPSEMTQGDIGGPDSEVFYEFTQIKHDAKFGKVCHPTCECGRFLEIGNSVFIQYVKKEDGSLEELPQKNVDFGGGLERLTAAANDNPDVFQIDIFSSIIKEIEKVSFKKYKENNSRSAMRVIADHLKATTFIIVNGVVPSNKQQGYVLRRLMRRAAVKMFELDKDLTPIPAFQGVAEEVLRVYDGTYFERSRDRKVVRSVIEDEINRFADSLDRGLKELEKARKEQLNTLFAFNLYQTHGFPFEVSKELIEKKGGKVKKEEFDRILQGHRKLSRKASVGLFKGGLADHSGEVIKLHTATHLLHWALREVLGKSVHQEGSNITKERLRFDFSHQQKLTESEIKKVEKLINEKIKEDLPVHKSVEEKEKALKSGALANFAETYPEKVSVYTIGKDLKQNWVSKEVCGGPHVKTTSEIGRVRIKKQEKIGAGLLRIYAGVDSTN